MSCGCSQSTVDFLGCPDFSTGICPDFQIKRHDTKPSLKVNIKDCGDPIDLTDVVVEVSMWANAKFKTVVATDDTYFKLADNIGFNQVLINDIIIVSDQIRAPEQMLVTGFDEEDFQIRVERGYHGTDVRSYKKGTKIKIFRMLNSVGGTELVLSDVLQVDGTTETDVLTESNITYDWLPQDTCLPGCYYLEFKLLKMTSVGMSMAPLYLNTPSATPSFSMPNRNELGCYLGDGVEWVRRFPANTEAYLVQIVDSPTSEALI